MSDLSRALAEFARTMEAKFEKVAYKHPDTTVTVDGNLERLPEFELEIEAHYRSEISERLNSPNDDNAIEEDVDVANLAFLDWYAKTSRMNPEWKP